MKLAGFIKLLLPACLLFLFANSNLKSQATGSFDVQIQFNGESRTFSYYVPPDYDSTKKSNLMVCLHGLGDNSVNFRNALINSLQWNTFIPNTIFVCPDGGSDANKDFYSPTGDEAIIPTTIHYTDSLYNIDTTQIILEGFSLGGRSALKYSLDHPGKFKGLLLNTPAQQGIKDTKNMFGSVQFNYSQGGKTPIAITHGADDIAYLNVTDSLYMQLILNDVPVTLTRVAGMAHTIPQQNVIQNCINFINDPISVKNEANVAGIISPKTIYKSTSVPSVRIRNTGSDYLTGMTIEYILNDTVKTFQWSGNIKPFDYSDVEIPMLSYQKGFNTLIVNLKEVNGEEVSSQSLVSKSDTAFIASLPSSEKLPAKFGFEANDDPYWARKASGNVFTWDVDDNSKTKGAYSGVMFNSPLFFDFQGLSEEVISPSLDLTSVQKPYLIFDYAFNYLYYTPPYISINTIFTDTLNILVSTDNGATYTKIYTKYGENLATAPTPITNATSINAAVFVPTINNWKTEKIDLSQLGNAKSAIFKFQYTSGLGGTIYLDNINFLSENDLADVNTKADNQEINISPNPAINYVNVQLPENTSQIVITDLQGMNLYTSHPVSGSKFEHISTDNFSSGIYFVKIIAGGKSFIQQLIIAK